MSHFAVPRTQALLLSTTSVPKNKENNIIALAVRKEPQPVLQQIPQHTRCGRKGFELWWIAWNFHVIIEMQFLPSRNEGARTMWSIFLKVINRPCLPSISWRTCSMKSIYDVYPLFTACVHCIHDVHPPFTGRVHCAQHPSPGSVFPYPRRKRWAASHELLLQVPPVREGLPFNPSCQALLQKLQNQLDILTVVKSVDSKDLFI